MPTPNPYTNIFGGQNINPTLLSYVLLQPSGDAQLTWPFAAMDGAYIAADKIDVQAGTNNLVLTMPDATLVSVGQDNLFNNTGSFTFIVKNFTGTQLFTLAPGQQMYLYLTANSTQGGTWDAVPFGSSGGGGSAASLAGAGLLAIVTTLNQNLQTTSLASNYSPGINDRATVLRNTGGSVTYTFGSAATLGNGWFVYVINGGSGTITLTPNAGQTIDGNANKVIQPTENLIVFSDGSNLNTLGYGRAVTSTVTGAAINVAGGSPVVLNTSQVLAQVQDYSGTLTANITVDYGTTVGYWFVRNNTAGAFGLTLRVNAADPGVAIAQGTFSIVRSNGTNMAVSFTATTGTVSSITTTSDLTGGPITSTGTLGLANTAVTAGTYGDASHTVTFTVDGKGRMTAAAQQAISIPLGQVQAFSSATLHGQITDPTGTGAAVFASGASLSNTTIASPTFTGTAVAPTPTTGDNSTKIATTAFVQSAIASTPGFQTGDFKGTVSGTLQTGWVFVRGLTIGNASSGATERANADCQNLFTYLWNIGFNVVGGRGASAAADWSANKQLTMPDWRGVTLVGSDNMGAGSRGIFFNFGPNGFVGQTSAGGSGAQSQTVQTNSGNNDWSTNITGGNGFVYGNVAGFHTHNVSFTVTIGFSIQTVQPSYTVNWMMKL